MKKTVEGKDKALTLLILAAAITFFLPGIPYGNYILWPFVILTTFIHEMGHGLMALAVGGSFLKLEIFSNASGLAWNSGVSPGIPHALVAAAGLLGPSTAGGLFILAGRSSKGASRAFLILSIFMLVSTAIWVRTIYGIVSVSIIGFIFLLISRRAEPGTHQFLIQFLGAQMLADTLTRTMDYLFTGSVHVGGETRHSDTGTIAENLGGPYWFWGAILAVIAILIFILSLRRAYR